MGTQNTRELKPVVLKKQSIKDKNENHASFLPISMDKVELELNNLKAHLTQLQYFTAVQSLHNFFKQIVSNPENEHLRTIRKNHPLFIKDIGRYKSGVDLILACGFVTMWKDGIECYNLKEPHMDLDACVASESLELDEWSTWYDSVKEINKL